jgi:Tfp pilus assembly protein PilO
MEWDLIKLVWSSVLTIVVAIFGMLWRSMVEKLQDSHEKLNIIERELTKVKVEYVQKEEIHRIEARIDQRFSEMKEFFTEIVRKTL